MGEKPKLWEIEDQSGRLAELTADRADLKETPLRRDVRSLGRLLGQVLKEQGGPALFDDVERLRLLAIQHRDSPSPPASGRDEYRFIELAGKLAGEMSIVGPRPYMPHLDETFRRRVRGYRARHLVKPGITGLAQSLGYRGEILETEMLNRRVYWDAFYVGHWSIWLDLQITARSFWHIVRPPPTAY